MSTRAIAHESVTTAGGYISTKLSLWDKVRPLVAAPTSLETNWSCFLYLQTDQGQLWTITAA